jgi:hypothetical protein
MISGSESEWWDSGRAARHGSGRLVSLAHAEAGEPTHDGLHAARIRAGQPEVPLSTCCMAAVAKKMRG